jgi:hypothetical protein
MIRPRARASQGRRRRHKSESKGGTKARSGLILHYPLRLEESESQGFDMKPSGGHGRAATVTVARPDGGLRVGLGRPSPSPTVTVTPLTCPASGGTMTGCTGTVPESWT